MIDQATVDRIFDAAQIVDVVGDYITLKKRGVNYLGICPFHGEKTPSFTVSPAKNIYKCFGCGKGGNPVNFVMENEKISYYEALKMLAKRYNIEIIEEQQSQADIQIRTDRESMLIVSDFARKSFIDNLFTHTEGKTIGLSYFKERGFREETIRKFELGYCLEERDAFSKQALKEGFKLEYMTKTGLSIANDDRPPIDRFAGRVMFPIHNLSGKVIAFGGRVMKTDKKTAKYLNSPESEIYHKSNVLYGIFQAKNTIIQEDKCYLVEGYTDVIQMHQSGICNVVASSGTSLTPDQIRLIKRFTNNVTILYDGDPAGIKASLRGIDLILEEGMNVRVILLPTPEDPDSFARTRSTSELKEYLSSNETDFIHFKTNLLLADAQDPIIKAEAIAQIVKSISIVPDAITRQMLLRECAGILQMDESVLMQEVNTLRKVAKDKPFTRENPAPAIAHPVDETAVTKVEINDLEVVERELVRMMLNWGTTVLFEICNDDKDVTGELTVAEYILSEIEQDELEFHNAEYRRIYDEFKHNINNGKLIDFKYFTSYPDAAISHLTADLISQKYELSRRFTKREVFIETEDMKLKSTIPNLILTYKSKRLNMMVKQVQKRMLEKQRTATVEELTELQQKLMLLSVLKRELSKSLGNRIFF